MNIKEKEVLAFFLPEGTLEWFDLIEATKTDTNIKIILEEKNIPPVIECNSGKRIIAKGFKDIRIDDYPIRGRKTELIFRRRYWQVEDSEKLLKRDIQLCAEGTQLEREFANFLKEQG